MVGEKMQRKNIVILYTDQQRFDTINAMGYKHMHTPNLDRLCAKGTGFENFYVNSPFCMPSRHSFLSGLYPSSTGTMDNGIELDEDIMLLPHYLKPYGYKTANFAKFHGQNHSDRDHRIPSKTYGFDEFICSDEPGCYDDAYIKWVEAQAPQEVENCRCSTPPISLMEHRDIHPRETHEPYIFKGPEHLTHTAFVADQTIQFLKRHKDQLFCCIAGFYAPHTPVNPPKRFLDYYLDITKLPKAILTEEERKIWGLSDEHWLEVRRYYYALISHIDDQIGHIFKTFDTLNLWDNTIVIFTSDHGEYLGDHGLIQKGPPGFDCVSRVPLIIYHPDIQGGQKTQALTEAVDVLPTILDWAMIQSPPFLEGQSLKPLMEQKTNTHKDCALLELKTPGEISWRTIRTDEWRYSVNNQHQEFLFHIQSDISEHNNLAKKEEYHQKLAEMRLSLLQKMLNTETQFPYKTGTY